MVQTDVSQLSTEASEWRQILRNYREEFTDGKKALQEICRKSLSKEQLHEVEHFDNQFHIQLINIHDVKQEIKAHEKNVQFETSRGEVSEATFTRHEALLDKFLYLENAFQELRNEFKNFINASSC
jgi:hypothetical protein